MALRFPQSLALPCSPSSSSSSSSTRRGKKPLRLFRCSADNQALPSADARKLVLEVKDKLEVEHSDLPIGKNGRDDEDLILWFLKDRRFSVEDAVFKLRKAIKWRQEFGVSELTEESVRNLYETGKAYVHDFLDVRGRPALVVVASKHFPGGQDSTEDEKLCVFLIEEALCKLPAGKEGILTIIDLRGYRTENADVSFLRFLETKSGFQLKVSQNMLFGLNSFSCVKKHFGCNKDVSALQRVIIHIARPNCHLLLATHTNHKMDVFYYYYPRRLDQVVFVDAPFVFQPVWQLVRPWLKSYASLVRFCDVETLRKQYFTEATLPASFKD